MAGKKTARTKEKPKQAQTCTHTKRAHAAIKHLAPFITLPRSLSSGVISCSASEPQSGTVRLFIFSYSALYLPGEFNRWSLKRRKKITKLCWIPLQDCDYFLAKWDWVNTNPKMKSQWAERRLKGVKIKKGKKLCDFVIGFRVHRGGSVFLLVCLTTYSI